MNSVKVDKRKLVDTLKKNKEHHRAIFLEAQIAYREAVIKELDGMLADARNGKKIRRIVTLIEPQDHTKDYDRVIGMLQWSEEPSVVLSENDYRSYVLDSWGWKEQFLIANSSYSSTATADYIELTGEEPEV